jgi:hypothetical protein
MNSIEEGFLSRRTITILLFIFFIALAVVLLSSERGVSGAMERIGSFIADLFGY